MAENIEIFDFKNINKKFIGLLNRITTHHSLFLMAKGNIDFIFFDNEHSVFSKKEMQDLIVFGNNIGVPSIVRVTDKTRREIIQVLDSGALGVMAPMIETKSDAESLVKFSKYPKIGSRSLALTANTNYDTNFSFSQAIDYGNRKTVTIAQIETRLGVENVDDIISVPGIDGVIIGPVDLAVSYGFDDLYHPVVINAMKKVQAHVKSKNKTFGIIGPDKMIKQFNDYLQYSIPYSDYDFIQEGLKRMSKEL